MSDFTKNMTAYTVVQNPDSGEFVEWGTLSAQQKAQWMAEDAATNDYFTQIAETGSYRNKPAETVPAGYVVGPTTPDSGTYSVTKGYENVPVEATPGSSQQQTPAAAPYPGGAAPSYAGGYYGEQTGATGGGYDPRALEPYTQSPDFNSTTTWTGGGYDPDAQAGGYDPTTGYVQGAGNSIGGQAAISETYMGGKDIYAGGYAGDQTEPSGGGYDPTEGGLSDPKNARPGSKIPDGYSGKPAEEPSVAFSTEPDTGNADMDKDWRVRISLSERARFFYNAVEGNKLLNPLKQTNGVIFPYTPSITVSHVANYSSTNPTHSNYAQNFYNNSDVNDITITGDFTVQNISEGQYLMAVIYFFRAATKMFFGQGPGVGNPPPIVFLDGYGSHYFPHVPCVITNFSHTLSPDVDYIEIPLTTSSIDSSAPTTATSTNPTNTVATSPYGTTAYAGPAAPNFSTGRVQGNGGLSTKQITETSRVPTSSSISVTLKPQYSRRNLHDRFDLTKFAAGELLRDKTGGFGGFL